MRRTRLIRATDLGFVGRARRQPPPGNNTSTIAKSRSAISLHGAKRGNDSNLLIVFYVQIMPDDLVMQLHRF
ncbi:hypothetical protein B6I76_10675 [Klebsiella pneumoniae]|nr:hypothetical protein CI683_03945 [Klebsiella pneumoniae subsp. pneumoniae]OYJ12079.1 hypothetical protein CI682_03525 [Klebsiella pneumoniae subsp. pneumoniae]PLE66168.1 hypothetical protein B6I76_10675 [Klebsiella pneumoniae]